MTSHYEILKAWIDSCETELQLDNLAVYIENKLITDDKQRDDILSYFKNTLNNRAWIRSKVIARDYVEVSRFPVCDEQPSDNCSH